MAFLCFVIVLQKLGLLSCVRFCRGIIVAVNNPDKGRDDAMQVRLDEEYKGHSLLKEKGNIVAQEQIFEESAGLCLTYILLEEDGSGRAAFGTPCERMFSLFISAHDCQHKESMCLLRDMARTRERGLQLFALAKKGRITPWTAEEVAEELMRMLE